MIWTEKISLTVWLSVAILLQPAYTLAQSAPKLQEDQKSVVLVDLRVDQWIEEAVAAGFKKDDIDQIKLEQPLRGINPSQIERVFGAASLPTTIQATMEMMAGPPEDGFPFEFFLRIKFADTSALDQVLDNFSNSTEKITLGDKEYLTPRGSEKGLLYVHQVDTNTIEFGSKGYVQQAKRNFLTDRLNTAFQAAPKEPFRLVLDLETRREFIQEAVELGKQDLPPLAHAYLDLIDNAKSLAITSSLGSENLLSLIVEGNNDSDAEEFASGVNSLLELGKIGLGGMYGQLSSQMPADMKEPLTKAKALVDSLEADQVGTTVKLLIKKPEGFNEAIVQTQQLVAGQAKIVARQNNFRQIGLGILNFESAYRHFPFKSAENREHETISWRAKILPFIEEGEISNQMDLKKGAKEAPNAQFAKSMPEIYGADGSLATVAWIQSEADTFGDITDGSSNTIMLIENPKGRPWLEQNPLTIDEAVALVTGLDDGEDLIVAFYDGSVSNITNKVSEETLRNLFDPRDGNIVDMDWR